MIAPERGRHGLYIARFLQNLKHHVYGQDERRSYLTSSSLPVFAQQFSAKILSQGVQQRFLAKILNNIS